MAPEEGPPPPSGRTFDTARVVAHAQGKCPGIPTHEGGYSGCRGGADCPVCEGRPITPMPEAPGIIVERVVSWVHQEAQRIAEQLAAAKIAEAQATAALAGRQAEQLRAQLAEVQARLDEVIETARALMAGLPGVSFQCHQCDGLAMWCWPSPLGGVRFACDAHRIEGASEMDHAAHLRRLRALTSEEGA